MRQYIGARYVPQFYEGSNGNNWDGSSIPYEALTIVTYLGNSFTSKKPVPVGVDITDQEYWVLTSAYNSQIAQMQEDIDDLESQITLLTDRRVITIGDSYNTSDPTGAGDNVTPWAPKLAANMGLTLNDNWFNSGYSGAGFVKEHDSGHAFIDQLQAVAANITDKDTITDIVVAGGTNDGAYMSDLYGAIATFRTYCKSTFKNAKIWLFYVSWGIPFTSPLWNDIRSVYAAQARDNMIVFPDAFSSLLYQINWCNDNGHPNNNGATELGRYMFNVMHGGQPQVSWVTSTNINVSGNAGFSGTIKETQENTTLTVDIDLDNYNGTAIDYGFNTSQVINVSRLNLVNPYNNTVIGRGNGYCVDSTNKVYHFDWLMLYQNGAIKFCPVLRVPQTGNINPQVVTVHFDGDSHFAFNACEC